MIPDSNLLDAEGFPDELRDAIRALDDETRQKIVKSLLSKDFHYTGLQHLLNIPKNNLTYHLDELLKGAIIRNYTRDQLGSRYDSYYSLSDFGRYVIEKLYEMLTPPSEVPIVSFTSYYPRDFANASGTISVDVSFPTAAGTFIPTPTRFEPSGLEREPLIVAATTPRGGRDWKRQ